MHMHSPLVRCLLALTLLFGQSTAALHALEHLVPPTAGHAFANDSAAAPVSTREAAEAVDGTSPAHVDDGTCTLCLALGAGQAPARSPCASRLLVTAAGSSLPNERRTWPVDRPHRRPPVRGPPALS